MLRKIPFAFALLAVGGTQLSTTYTAEQSVRVSVESEFSIETTSFEMTVDGEPVEGGGFGGGGGSETSRKLVHVDKWVGVEDGHAKKVERTFEDLVNKSVMRFGENERESSAESPLAGVTLELTAGKDGEVEVKVKEGDTPAQEVALQHHQLTLALDALLPDGEKEAGAKWDLDKAAVRRALLADVTPALFPPPEQTEESGGGPGGRRGGRGRGGSSGRVFDLADWTGKATYSGDEEHDGAQCAVIELEIEADGELPEMPRGGRRGGDVFAPELVFPSVGPKFEVKLEGKLFYSLADKRPIGLELEGTVRIETDEDREGREGGTMHISSTQEGKFTQKVTITKAE